MDRRRCTKTAIHPGDLSVSPITQFLKQKEDFSSDALVFFRIMSICGVLAETNRQLGGKASCSIDGGSVLCTGKKCYLDHAKQTLGKVVIGVCDFI